jgi:hypothetical protein
MSDVRPLLARLWDDYAAINPQAKAIHKLLGHQGETVVNDHIALRTFDDPRVNLDTLARAFVAGGHKSPSGGEYTFPDKKLFARHFEHADASLPKVFISELRLRDFSPELNAIVKRLLDQMPRTLPGADDFAVAGRPWKISFSDYETLRKESEYAAWMSAFGFRANHFTVLVNALKNFPTLQDLNTFLKSHGFALNTSGGEIKGSPVELLEQSSTLADKTTVDFTDAPRTIPACYYEFARRYPTRDGRLFTGFVAQSADKIFESTNKR